MQIKNFLIILFFLGVSCLSYAQDIQFSQYYAAPLYLNPALAGSSDLGRVGINYRNQWPSINAHFTTYSVYFDNYFYDYNSGVGVLLFADREANAGYSTYSASLQYAYNLHLSQGLSLRVGAEGNRTWRSIDYSRLVFGDQLGSDGIVNPVSGEGLGGGNVGFWDLSGGVFLYSRRFWLGGAAHHVLQPNVSLQGGSDPLPRKFSVHGGYKIMLHTESNYAFRAGYRENSLTPTFNFKMQGVFSQLDVGMYYTYEPIVLGVWYRGLPIKTIEGQLNNESIIALLGYSMNGVNVGYSFDYPISALGIRSGGAHEISASYQFFIGDPRKPPKNVRKIPCPRF